MKAVYSTIIFSLALNFSFSQIDTFYRNGSIHSIGEYDDNNRRTGMWKFLHPNGSLVEYGNYSNGKRNGHWKFYLENGLELITKEGDYDNGIKNGQWIYYHLNGQVEARGSYLNDVEEGDWIYYYPSGKMLAQGSFLSQPNGPAFNTNSGGYFGIRPEALDSKMPMSIDAIKTGRWNYYHNNGQILETAIYINGKQEGTWETYHENGEIKASGELVNGLQNGEWKYFRSDGSIKELGHFSNGKHLDWCEFHANGSEYRKILYENGKIWNIAYCKDQLGNDLDKGTLLDGNGSIHTHDSNGDIIRTDRIVNGVQIFERNL